LRVGRVGWGWFIRELAHPRVIFIKLFSPPMTLRQNKLERLSLQFFSGSSKSFIWAKREPAWVSKTDHQINV